MPKDDPGLSPSEQLLRAARGDETFDSPADLDFDLDGGDEVPAGTVESAVASDVGGLTAADIAAELAESGALAIDEAPVIEPVTPVEPAAKVEPVAPVEQVAEEAPAEPYVRDITDPAQVQPAPPSDPWSEPSQEWLEREAARPKKRRPVLVSGSVSWIRIAISVAVFVFVAFGFIGAQFDGNEPVENLAVGDCFVAGQVEEIESVPVVACSEPHDSEVMASIEITGFGSSYPGEDPLFEALFDDCVTQFPAYVGEPFETSVYYIDTWIPLVEGWNDGDRTGLCTVVQVDESFDIVSITGSAKDSALNA
ncbi:MAG: septum formation family protein [Acidimicrobiia bacterium]